MTTPIKPKLTLYDLAGAQGNQPFSPNAWQTRLALNYKRLPFETVWLNLVDIKPTMEGIGAQRTTRFPLEPDGVYTIPVLVDTSHPGSPKVISDSRAIAEYLDETYPERPILPRGTKALLALFHTHIQHKFLPVMISLLVPRTLSFLAERDHVYFRETRERWLSIKIEDICPTDAKREEQLQKLKEELDVLAGFLNKNGEEMELVLGNQVSAGDFVIIALFAWQSKLDPDGWEKVKTWNGGRWEKLWRRSEDWRLNKA